MVYQYLNHRRTKKGRCQVAPYARDAHTDKSAHISTLHSSTHTHIPPVLLLLHIQTAYSQQDPGYPSTTNKHLVVMMVPETMAINVNAAYTAAAAAITTNRVAVISGRNSNCVVLLLRLGRLDSRSF